MAAFFQAEQIGKRFGGVWALGPLDFTLAAGECLAVVGPSGSGKSTLLRLVAGLSPLDSGRMVCLGSRWDVLPSWRRRIAWVTPQGYFFPQWTVRQNLEFRLREAARDRFSPGSSCWKLLGGGGNASAAFRQRAEAILAKWGLSHWAQRRPHELSAGERQRAALAAVSGFRRRLVLLDEPLGHVDVVERPTWVRAWRELQQRRRQTTLYVTHDPAEAALVADRVLLLRQGKLEQLSTFAELTRSPASSWAAEWAARPNQNLIVARRVETASGPQWEAGGFLQPRLPPPAPGERSAQLRFAAEAARLEVSALSETPAFGEGSAPATASKGGGAEGGSGGGLGVCGIVLATQAAGGGGRCSIVLPTEECVWAAAASPTLPLGASVRVWIPAAALHWSVRVG